MLIETNRQTKLITTKYKKEIPLILCLKMECRNDPIAPSIINKIKYTNVVVKSNVTELIFFDFFNKETDT